MRPLGRITGAGRPCRRPRRRVLVRDILASTRVCSRAQPTTPRGPADALHRHGEGCHKSAYELVPRACPDSAGSQPNGCTVRHADRGVQFRMAASGCIPPREALGPLWNPMHSADRGTPAKDPLRPDRSRSRVLNSLHWSLVLPDEASDGRGLLRATVTISRVARSVSTGRDVHVGVAVRPLVPLLANPLGYAVRNRSLSPSPNHIGRKCRTGRSLCGKA